MQIFLLHIYKKKIKIIIEFLNSFFFLENFEIIKPNPIFFFFNKFQFAISNTKFYIIDVLLLNNSCCWGLG